MNDEKRAADHAAHMAVWARIHAAAEADGLRKMQEQYPTKRKGTKSYANLLHQLGRFENDRLTWQYHMGGFNPSFLAGGVQ